MHRLELRIPPLAVAAFFAMLMVTVTHLVPVAFIHLPGQLSLTMALLLALTGACVAASGVIAFRRHQTTVNPLTPEQSSTLVVSRIYRFSRNPMYLGFFLGLCGWSLYLRNGIAALLLPFFIAYMGRFQIQPEERALSKRFGAQFTAYQQQVRRWL